MVCYVFKETDVSLGTKAKLGVKGECMVPESLFPNSKKINLN
jgi:hypothetical protein